MVIDPATTKYLIKATIKADGVIEKSDVVGAIFGQTEGLLGTELDLRELQRSARVGRIEVELESKNGKSTGTITLPTSLDKVETVILAAAFESIDRVGEEITNFGPDHCPSGPNIDKSDAIIIVEGRRDVLNLLKYGIKNVIAVGGTNIPKTVIELTKERISTAFVDGDRGGELILKELLQTADVDFVARAPQTREVEEIPQKLVMKSLKNKIPAEQYAEMYDIKFGKDEDKEESNFKQKNEQKKKEVPKVSKQEKEEVKIDKTKHYLSGFT